MLRPISAEYWQVKVSGSGMVQLNASSVINDRGRGSQTYAESIQFLGATGKGPHPSTGCALMDMRFQVPVGDDQTWLFSHSNTGWRLLSARWTEGNLQVFMNTDLPVSVGKRHLEAWVEGKRYVTDRVLGAEPGQYRVCDPIDLLQCLEGRITPRALALRSKKLTIEDPRDIRIRELQEQHADQQAKITNLETSLAQREDQISRKEGDIQSLRDNMSDIAQRHDAALVDREFWESAARNMFRVLRKVMSSRIMLFMLSWKISTKELEKLEHDLVNSGRFDDQVRAENTK